MRYPPEETPEPGTMPARLREEREQIGLSRKELAARLHGVGVRRLDWAESPAGEPLKKLTPMNWAEMAREGMDIQYIMTGQRSIRLSAEEEALLENYRACSPENKGHLETAGAAVAQSSESMTLDNCDTESFTSKGA